MLTYYPHLTPKQLGIHHCMGISCRILEWTWDAAWCGWLLPFQDTQKKPEKAQERVGHNIKMSSKLLLFAALSGNCVKCLKHLLQRFLMRQLKVKLYRSAQQIFGCIMSNLFVPLFFSWTELFL